MKLLIVKTFLVSLILSSAYTGAAEDSDVYKNGGNEVKKEAPKDIPNIKVNPDFKVLAEMPQVPSILPIYKVEGIDPTAIDLPNNHLSQVFDFNAEDKGVDKNTDGVMSVMFTDTNKRSLEFFSSGAAFFMNEELFSEHSSDLLRENHLSQESAKEMYKELSWEFLNKNDLVNSGMVFNNVSFMNIQQFSIKDNKESSKVVGAAAHYSYELSGVPAWGPGAKTTVYFGPEGITGFYNAIPKLDVVGEGKTLHPKKVVDKYISAGQAQTLLRLHSGVVEQVIIESVELVYYVDAGNKAQEVVTPHYLISGMFYGNDISSSEKGMIETEFQWLTSAVTL